MLQEAKTFLSKLTLSTTGWICIESMSGIEPRA